MFTVIIAEKKHFDTIEQNRLYFEPFFKQIPEEFAFCEWNPSGNSFRECVPDLVTIVGRKKEWRAIILNEDSHNQMQNPFDVISYDRIKQCNENYGLTSPNNDIWEENDSDKEEDWIKAISNWQKECNNKSASYLEEKEKIFRDALRFPLQRLSTCLCYLPSNSELSDFGENESIDSEVQYSPEWCEETLSAMEYRRFMQEEKLKIKLRTECINDMLEKKEENTQFATVGISLPTEVYCLSTRETENGFSNDNTFWKDHTNSVYSEFVTRNMYFDKMKFIVSDILPKNHQNHLYSKICLLYNILLLATNDVPIGIVSPRKLYRLQSENNEEALSSIISAYVCKLNNTIDLIEQKVKKIENDIPGEISDEKARMLFCINENVPVVSNNDFPIEDIYANQKDYGYFSDSHGDEINAWGDQCVHSAKVLENFSKQPRRALKKAVDCMDYYCNVDANMIRALNSFQMDDVKDYTENYEDKMISIPVVNIFNLSEYQKKMNDSAENVKKIMMGRMKKKTALFLSMTCLILFLISFIPLFTSNSSDRNTLSMALILGAASAVSLLLVFFIAILLMRYPLKEALDSYNQTAKECVEEIRSSLSRYSEYLSSFCNVRRGYKVINFSKKNLDKYDRTIRTLNKHKRDIQKIKAAVIDSYGDFVRNEVKVDEIISAPYQYDFCAEKKEYTYFPPYYKENYVTIDFLEKGNKISIPSSFVSNVALRMEEIYDE